MDGSLLDIVALGDRLPQDRNAAAISPQEAILRREIARLLTERTSLREDVAALSEKLEQLGEKAERIRNEFARGEDESRLLQANLLNAMGAAEYYRSAVDLIYRSRSWRVTKPLRAVTTLLRGAPEPHRPVEIPLLTRSAPATDATLLEEDPVVSEDGTIRASSPAKSSRGHLFVAADMPPLFDQQAGALRLMTLIGLLKEAGWTLAFGSLCLRQRMPGVLASAEGRAHYEARLRQAGVDEILYGPDEIDDYFLQPATRLDWAFLSFPVVATALMPLIRCRFPKALVIYDMVDSHGLRMAREAALASDFAKAREARSLRGEEAGLALAADVTLAISADERDRLLEEAPQAVVKVIPLVFDIPPPSQPLQTRRGLFFIGGFWHKPNGDGMIWFADAIWPRIRSAMPEVTLTIAGSNMEEDVLALGGRPGIDVVGFVPEVQPLLDRHRVFVAPLRYGAGMKGKVAQSMIHGLPVVATGIGAEGMGLEHGTHLLVADDPAAFAEAVLSLLQDDALWEQLSGQGRQHIERTLSRDAVRLQLEAVFGG